MAAIVNLARQQIAGFAVAPRDRVLQLASWSFDASVSELAMAADVGRHPGGGAGRSVAGRVAALARLLARERIGVCTLPPSLLAVLAPDGFGAACRDGDRGGEALPPALAARWAAGAAADQCLWPDRGDG